jgi:hypothetical protein
MNPWDREIWMDGNFQFHPEYVQALAHQKIEPDQNFRIETPNYKLAKM